VRVLIIGANQGIGLEFCRQYKKMGHCVLATCRTSSEELNALEVSCFPNVDVTNQDSLNKLRRDIEDFSIDLLIANAGVLTNETLEEMNFDSIRTQFEVNSIGVLRSVHTLLPCLKRPSKIGIMSSKMGSVTDNTSGGRYGYRMSKAAVNIAGKSLSLDLRAEGISVGILHPGYVRTNMTGGVGLLTPEEAVDGLVKVVEGLTLENTGGFWHSNGETVPW
jgi:NAD(P)-dependent dehydrogenase (short-subunit alcohol dehydrogenase family)